MMRKGKRWLAMCLVLLTVVSVPAFSLANDVNFIVNVTINGSVRTRELTGIGYWTIRDLDWNISDIAGTRWSSGLPKDDLVRDHYSGTVTIDVNGSSGWPYPSAYMYVLPFGYGYINPGAPIAQSSDSNSTTTKTQDTGAKTQYGITWSTKYVYQAILNNKGIDFRLFGDGVKLAFLMKVDQDDAGKLYMALTVYGTYEQLKPVCTNAALSQLKTLGIESVRISSGAGSVSYSMSELEALATD